MNNNIPIIIGATIGSILLLILIIIILIYCYKQSQSKQDDSLHSVIIDKHFRSISFINNDYHNNMTLLASPRRLALLELQQTFTYENSSFDFNEFINTKTMRF
jgi:uncharacterized membrane protein YukC